MPVARAGDRWTAFVLSLFVPGAGHAFAGSPWAPAWALVFLVLAGLGLPQALLLPLGLLSAAHAMRALGGRAGGDVRVRLARGRVDLATSLVVERPHGLVWAFVSDVELFGRCDPFHDRVRRLAGGRVLLEHCAFGWRFDRVGRIFAWREGRGYVLSDLSRRGPRRGFPHVFFVAVEALDARRTRLTVRVRGRWTARLVPPPLARLWLRLVAREHGRLLAGALA